jgi:hypothetical protein
LRFWIRNHALPRAFNRKLETMQYVHVADSIRKPDSNPSPDFDVNPGAIRMVLRLMHRLRLSFPAAMTVAELANVRKWVQ